MPVPWRATKGGSSMSKNIRAISARQHKNKTLFEALQQAAAGSGAPSHEQLRALAEERLVTPAVLLGTSSFYDFLRAENRGKRAYVCQGTSCMLSGRQRRVRAALEERFSEDEVGEINCLGHCYCGGAFQVGEAVFDDAHGLETEGSSGAVPFYPVAATAMFADEGSDVEALYQTAFLAPERVMQELSDSRLRGRGGAGFYFSRKLTACANAPAGQKYVVCNADEGDPGAFSDRYLLEQQPHRVLAGMLAAGLAAGADSGIVYLRAEYPLALARVREAIQAFEQTSAFEKSGFHFRIVRGAGSYICGEETALLNSIEGLRPEVRTRPPYPVQEGLYDRPTLLSNVETFAAVPWILQQGGKAFAAIGTEKSTGTKLVSLDHGFNRPGVYEVEMGTALQQIIAEHAGGFRTDAKAVQVGGPLGGVVPVEKIASLTLDFESLAEEGFMLGHAGIVAIPQHFPMIKFLRHLFSFMAGESCGKCLPCRLGTEKGRTLLKQATAENPVDSGVFADLLETLELGSLCGLGGGLPLPVRNILTHFQEEVSVYFSQEQRQ